MPTPSSIPTRMRAAVQHAARDVRIEERAVPTPGPGEILLRVQATGICGSDLHTWREAIYGPGIVMGHELCGEVAALGAGVAGVPTGVIGAIYSGIPCGKCARCQGGLGYYCQDGHGLGSSPVGGLGEYVVAPASSFLAAPAGADAGAVAFSEPLANGLRALDFAEAREARTAVLIGAGPIGLSCLVAARRAGVERVVAVEGRARRAQAALALGAESVIDPRADDLQRVLRETFEVGADLVIEAVGLPDTIRQSFRWVRPGGTVVLMGVCLEDVSVRPIGWLLKELTIRSSFGCSADDQRRALELIARGDVDAASLVTRRIPLEDAPDALAELAAGADEIKVVVEHARA